MKKSKKIENQLSFHLKSDRSENSAEIKTWYSYSRALNNQEKMIKKKILVQKKLKKSD
jgi:hypothetical protein